jgi:hypothetical protein
MWTHRPDTAFDKTSRLVLRDGIVVGHVHQGMQVKTLRWFWALTTGQNGSTATMQEALEAVRQAVLSDEQS